MCVALWFVAMETTYTFNMCPIVNNCEQLYMVVMVTVMIGCHGYIRDWLSWSHL